MKQSLLTLAVVVCLLGGLTLAQHVPIGGSGEEDVCSIARDCCSASANCGPGETCLCTAFCADKESNCNCECLGGKLDRDRFQITTGELPPELRDLLSQPRAIDLDVSIGIHRGTITLADLSRALTRLVRWKVTVPAGAVTHPVGPGEWTGEWPAVLDAMGTDFQFTAILDVARHQVALEPVP